MNGNALMQDAVYLSFLDDLGQLSEVAARVRKKLVLLAPAKDGSYLHLMQETARGIEESIAGKGAVFVNAQEAIKDLHRLRNTYARKKTSAV